MAGLAKKFTEVERTARFDRAAGYVLDNMEGAVDRAAFLAKTDMPIAIIGARGTGKMYVAGVVHQESGGESGMLCAIDCRDFRNREIANQSISDALASCRGKTLVFKYPHLMCADAQHRLARQLTTRIVADTQPPVSLPRAKFVALFPDTIERLVQNQALTERLGSVFAGYPIYVPPIKDRQRAVQRWADKILQQECEDRSLPARQFTPEAEKAMLCHSWDGNISEMRQRIVHALQTTTGGWVSPTDLALFCKPGQRSSTATEPLLDGFGGEISTATQYQPTASEQLAQRLAEAVHRVLNVESAPPLGIWLEDEVTLAVLQRSGGQPAKAARHLHTTSRNIQRWLPRIELRTEQRASCLHWQPVARLIQSWISEQPADAVSPLDWARTVLIRQLESQGSHCSVKHRATLLGVSVPTYNKRLKEMAAVDQRVSGW